jgi:hypothetical protein
MPEPNVRFVQIRLVEDDPGSYKFTFATERGGYPVA